MPVLTGRDDQPIEITQDRFDRLVTIFTSNQPGEWPPDWAPLKELPNKLADQLERAQEEIHNQTNETLRIFNPEGELVYSHTGRRDVTSVPISQIPYDSIALHNHPQSTPPSKQARCAFVACE